MSEILVNKLTGKTAAGNVTITDGSVTMKLQDGVIKFWTAYDAQTQTTDGSLNQSSLTDQQTGIFYSSFTNSFGSATDKCSVGGAYNTTSNTSPIAGSGRAGLHVSVGAGTGTFRAISAGEVQYGCYEGASSNTNGDVVDAKGVYMTVTGDLA